MGEMQQADDIVLRPSHRRYRQWLGKPGFVAAGIAALALASSLRYADSGTETLLVVGLALAAAAAAFGAITLSIRTASVRLAPAQIVYRRWWVRRTSLDLDEDIVGVLAPHTVPLSDRSPVQLLILRGRAGGPRIRLYGTYWSTDDLERIALHAGVEPTAKKLTTSEFEDRVRHITYWRDRHWVAFGLGMAVIVVALVAGGVIATFVSQGKPPFDEQPPRAVSAATVEQQDAVAKDLMSLIDVEWGSPEERLLKCQDGDGYKGWKRWLQVAAVRPDDDAPPGEPQRTPALEAEIEAAMSRNGYPDIDDAPMRERQIVGYADTESSTDVSVEVAVEGTSSDIVVRAGCEVPDR